jgi:predicted enzyme related to lactoylglutathione lyase
VPFPFGQERTGYLVTDLDEALKQARESGAEVVVAPFKDSVGRDAIVQWDGGVKTQLYWHTTAPSYDPLESIPDNRVYLSPDRADRFVRQFLKFSGGTIVSDEEKADAGEIGRPGQTYRRVRIESLFGKMQVNVTDGHLPYPFGRELAGYQVNDLDATLSKAKSAGARVLSDPYNSRDRTSAMVEFPGGYIAEVHALKRRVR